jgi:hypothetical protein
MNKYYNYGGMFLWDQSQWLKRSAPVTPLLLETLRLKKENFGKNQKLISGADGHEVLYYSKKTNTYVFKDVKQYYKDKGQSFRQTGMGAADWIAIYPERLDKYEGPEPEVLIVLEFRDGKDPWAAMDILERHKILTDTIIAEGKAVVYFMYSQVTEQSYFAFTNITQEIAAYLHINLTKIYLDVSPIIEAGKKLSDIKGLELEDVNRAKMADPDACVEELTALKIPSVNISGQWSDGTSLTALIIKISENPSFSKYFIADRIIQSQTGKRMAEGFKLEYYYDTPEHPELEKHFDKMGLCIGRHITKGDQWYSIVPKQVYDEPGKKLPVMLLLVEVSQVIPHRVLTAFSNYYEYIELAASGDLMLVMFALEDIESNERMFDIYEEVIRDFPADSSRVYLSGFSHNSQLAIDLCHRHHDKLAGMATLGHRPGYQNPSYSNDSVPISDQMIEEMSCYDMPVINICGIYENDFYRKTPGSEEFKNLVDAWQRRLKASRCPIQSFEEIAAAQNATDYITNSVCLKSDRKELQMMFGLECFINDYKNIDGNYHLRLVTLGDLVHTYAPQMPHFSWNFLRRFSREISSGKIIELY